MGFCVTVCWAAQHSSTRALTRYEASWLTTHGEKLYGLFYSVYFRGQTEMEHCDWQIEWERLVNSDVRRKQECGGVRLFSIVPYFAFITFDKRHKEPADAVKTLLWVNNERNVWETDSLQTNGQREPVEKGNVITLTRANETREQLALASARGRF